MAQKSIWASRSGSISASFPHCAASHGPRSSCVARAARAASTTVAGDWLPTRRAAASNRAGCTLALRCRVLAPAVSPAASAIRIESAAVAGAVRRVERFGAGFIDHIRYYYIPRTIIPKQLIRKAADAEREKRDHIGEGRKPLQRPLTPPGEGRDHQDDVGEDEERYQ